MREILTYYNFQTFPLAVPPKRSPAETKSRSVLTRWLPEEGVVKWASNKANSTWTGFGQASEGSWKLRAFRIGERLIDRIDFEEFSLKALNVYHGPSIQSLKNSQGVGKEWKATIPLIYPPSIQSGEASLEHLRLVITERIPSHKRGFWTWLIIAPLTTPFMIIPIIPNFPFFFCAWRAWGHLTALRSSRYLDRLLDLGVIIPKAQPELDKVYKEYKPPEVEPPSAPSTNDVKPPTIESSQTLLLTRDAIPAILRMFGLKQKIAAGMYHAVEQARVRVTHGKPEWWQF